MGHTVASSPTCGVRLRKQTWAGRLLLLLFFAVLPPMPSPTSSNRQGRLCKQRRTGKVLLPLIYPLFLTNNNIQACLDPKWARRLRDMLMKSPARLEHSPPCLCSLPRLPPSKQARMNQDAHVYPCSHIDVPTCTLTHYTQRAGQGFRFLGPSLRLHAP